MNRWPLRWQLAFLTTALVAVVIIGVGLAASSHLYREGVADLDTDLQAVSRGLFTALDTLPDLESRRAALQELLPHSQRLYLLEITGADGQPVYRSRELEEGGIPALKPGSTFEVAHVHHQWMRVGRFEHKGIVLKIGMSLHTLREARADLWRGYLTVGPLVLVIVAAGGWWIARRALQPVEDIVASAERITARRLDQRLPVPAANDELKRLTNVLNHMIDRLEGSFRQATRFTADASHELKTPLTIIRGELESALRERGLTPSQEKLLINLLEETERLTHITHGLLLLSQADAGRLRITPVPVDLSTLLQDLLEDAEILAAPAEILVQADVPPHAELKGDPNFLRQLLLNLLDNAIKYNEHGGSVRIVLERAGAQWQVRVGNTGAGVAQTSEEHVFDRFFRGDPSRNRGRPGHGLGLSICREIARAHGGEIRLERSHPGWTEFLITLPAHASVSQDTLLVAG